MMVRTPAALAVMLLLLTPVDHVAGQGFNQIAVPDTAEVGSSIHLPRISRAPALDDFLEGRSREAEATVGGFRQRDPRDGRPASQQTTVYLSYDEQNLYVVFVCQDDPAKVRARMAKREDISEDDRVTVYLDSFHDGQRAYVFSSNPFGVQRDGIATEGQPIDYRFDALWRAEGRLTRDGFVVLMAIPFKSLRFPTEPGHTWGIALGRSVPHSNENSYWPYITLRKAGFVAQMATLNGLDHIPPSRNVQLNPYGTFTGTHMLDSHLPGFTTTRDSRIGADAKIVIRDNASLDVTANPDFSQVESDDPQVIVNQRYEVVFPEKRPFFLENAGYFATPINLFFSRRIADPDVGARLTTQFGGWTLGGLATDDRADGRLDATSPQYGDRAEVGVFRLQRQIGRDSRIAALATTRDFGGVQNHVASIDTRLALTPNWYLTSQATHSIDRDQYDKRSEGNAYSAELTHGGEHFSYDGSYKDFSPDFKSTLGYIKRTDLRRSEHFVGYIWRPESSTIRSFGPGATIGADWDYSGQLQDRWTYADFGVEFSGPAGARISRYDAFERYLDRDFRYAKSTGSFYVSAIKSLSFDGSYTWGDGINYSPAGGLDPYLGVSREVAAGFTLRPTTRVNVQQYYDYIAFRTPDAGVSQSRRIFDNQIARTKINIQFTRALSVRGIFDFYGLLPDSTLIDDERYKQVVGDVLVTWLVQPGTAFYAGYNSRLENVLFDPASPRIQSAAAVLRPTGQQVFVKISYLFHF